MNFEEQVDRSTRIDLITESRDQSNQNDQRLSYPETSNGSHLLVPDPTQAHADLKYMPGAAHAVNENLCEALGITGEASIDKAPSMIGETANYLAFNALQRSLRAVDAAYSSEFNQTQEYEESPGERPSFLKQEVARRAEEAKARMAGAEAGKQELIEMQQYRDPHRYYIEKKFPDGTKMEDYIRGLRRTFLPDGTQIDERIIRKGEAGCPGYYRETMTPNGQGGYDTVRENSDGTKVSDIGQDSSRKLITEYPDGGMTIIYEPQNVYPLFPPTRYDIYNIDGIVKHVDLDA